MTIYAKEPYVLHLLAGSANISALDAAKALLDSGRHNVNECEPDERLSVLHVAAAWDNLAMCQLLVHYGADIDAVDTDGRRPIDLANGRSRKFLKKFRRKHLKERNKIRKIFAFLFGHACREPKNLNVSTMSGAYRPAQRSCPVLPSAPTLHDLTPPGLFAVPTHSEVSGKTSTSSYVTANDVLSSIGEPQLPALGQSVEKLRTSLGDTIAVVAQQRTISDDNGDAPPSPFVNVTLRRQRKKQENGKSPVVLSGEPRERTSSSLSCGTADRAYLSSDHTTPRHSDNGLLAERWQDVAPRNRVDEMNRFSRSIHSERLKSFGPQNELSIYPDLYADIQGVAKHANREQSHENDENEAICTAGGHIYQRPYNEILSDVAAGLAALDLNRSPDPYSEEILVDDAAEVTAEESRIRTELSAMSLDELRRQLAARRCSVGPISAANRRLYEVKLAHIEMNVSHGDDSDTAKYSKALQIVLHNAHRPAVAELIGVAEERELRQHFQSPVGVRHAASASQVACFCYLLIDPSMIADFERCTLREFVNAIFYIGKGTGARPFSHLIDACNLRRAVVPKKSEKVRRILDLWDRSIGVVSLQIYQNIHAEEALIRERCMIEAIGIENLTNVRRGKVTGLPVAWTQRRITELGASLLRRAHTIIRHERCRPIMEAEVAAMSPYRPPMAQAPRRPLPSLPTIS